MLEFGVDCFTVRSQLTKEAILAAAFNCFEDMDRNARYTLKHKDEESGHFVNICDYNELKANEKIIIALKAPGMLTLRLCYLCSNSEKLQVMQQLGN